jgi:hypothetical protein
MHRTEQHFEGSSIGGAIGSLFDIPILPNGDDPEEEMFRRRMQRKKRKRDECNALISAPKTGC